jgi:hypothetical protein
MGMICEVYVVPAETAQKLAADPTGVHDVLAQLQEPESALSLEKSWHGLHYVLTGTAWEGTPPLNFIAGGGQPVGDEDVGYGPARLLPPADVKALDTALNAFSDQDFARKFDPHGLTAADIYPQIWDEPLEDLLQEYNGYFHELKSLIKQAAGSGSAILVAIT